MASSNPAFTNSPAFSSNSRSVIPAAVSAEQLDELYGRPSATPVETDRMTYEDTIVKTVVSFAILVAGAVVGWIVPVLALPAALIGFVLALVNIFKKKPSKALVLSYAAFEGVFIGGISAIFETLYPGIAVQAVLATLAVVGVTLALFTSGKIRASARATKIFLIAMVGYAVFSLLNFGLMVFGANTEPFGLRSFEIIPGVPLGLVLGILVVLMAAYSLVLDFDNVQQGVRRGIPRVFAWQAAFGIMMTVVWLYVEILRLLAILRGND
jgi:uncharacterized YccA/Bax inhibitor family protein